MQLNEQQLASLKNRYPGGGIQMLDGNSKASRQALGFGDLGIPNLPTGVGAGFQFIDLFRSLFGTAAAQDANQDLANRMLGQIAENTAAQYGSISREGQRTANMLGNAGTEKLRGIERLGTLMELGTADLGKAQKAGLGAFSSAYLADLAGNTRNVEAGFAQRTSDVMGLLEGMGTQAKADVGMQWESEKNRSKQDLLASGLGGTVAATTSAGLERQKQFNLNRLDETLRQQKAGFLSDLTGQALAAGSQANAMRLQASGALGQQQLALDESVGLRNLGAIESNSLNKINALSGERDRRMALEQYYGGLGRGAVNRGIDQELGVLSGITIPYPNQDFLSNYAGSWLELGNTMEMRKYQASQQPSWGESLLGTGINTAATIGALGFVPGGYWGLGGGGGGGNPPSI